MFSESSLNCLKFNANKSFFIACNSKYLAFSDSFNNNKIVLLTKW